MISLFLPFDGLNLWNDYTFMNPKYDGRLCFLKQTSWSNCQYVRQCDFTTGCYTTNQTTKECRPTQVKIKDNNVQKETMHKNQKFRSASTQLRERPTEPNRSGTNLLQQHLFYKNNGLKNYTFIDAGTSILIFVFVFSIYFFEVKYFTSGVGLNRFWNVEHSFLSGCFLTCLIQTLNILTWLIQNIWLVWFKYFSLYLSHVFNLFLSHFFHQLLFKFL